jgi:hypothetical protein
MILRIVDDTQLPSDSGIWPDWQQVPGELPARQQVDVSTQICGTGQKPSLSGALPLKQTQPTPLGAGIWPGKHTTGGGALFDLQVLLDWGVVPAAQQVPLGVDWPGGHAKRYTDLLGAAYRCRTCNCRLDRSAFVRPDKRSRARCRRSKKTPQRQR